MAWFATKPILMRCYKNKIEKKTPKIFIYVMRTKKKIFRTICWKLLDEAELSAAMSPKYYFRPCITDYFLVDCKKICTRKNFHSVVKVTFDS
jgi:hypothetical protein